MREARFAVQPQGHNPPRHAHGGVLRFERGGVPVPVARHNPGYRGRLLKAVRIRILAERFHFGELFLALEILIERLKLQTVVLPPNTDREV